MENPPPTPSEHERLRELYAGIYKEQEAPFGEKPNDIVTKIPSPHLNGTALDLGSGNGRHSIYLAKQGFSVDAVDLSEVGITRLEEWARQERLDSKISTQIAAAEEVRLEGVEYEAIVCALTLHHLERSRAEQLLTTLQQHTSPGGTNAIITFTNRGDFAKRRSTNHGFYPDQNELKTMYETAGWKLTTHVFEERKTRSGELNEIVYMLAHKPSTAT